MVASEYIQNRVTVVSVCFNSSSVAEQMLETVPDGVPVILVDNGSADATALQELGKDLRITVVLNPENMGFGAACNLGAVGVDTEFLLFLNPDAALETGALQSLVDAADRHPEASAFNPTIQRKPGQSDFRRSSALLPRRAWLSQRISETDLIVPVLSGAAFFVRRTAFEAVGGFDPEIFLYHEDDDLSLRLKTHCGPLMYIPDACVRHVGGRSSPRSAEIAALKAWHMGKSRVYAARKHHLPFAFWRAFGVALLQLLSPLTLLSRRKRAKNIAFLGAVWASR